MISDNDTRIESVGKLPLRGWPLEFARRWNSNAYSLFVLHGNIFDVFPLQSSTGIEFVPIKGFITRRLFPDRDFLMFYDISDGLTFGTPDMQKRFFEWLEVYDQVEKTAYRRDGPPREFTILAPVLRRFFLYAGSDVMERQTVTLVIDFPEKIVPATEEAGASTDERRSLVTLLKWASSTEMRRMDICVVLVTESSADLHSDILQNPHVAQIFAGLPDVEDRARFLESPSITRATEGKSLAETSDVPVQDLAARTAGLNLLRAQHLIAEAVRNGLRITPEIIAAGKKRLIEEYCQGLVKFKDPKPGLSLDAVATHTAAKKKLRELAWLIRNGKGDVLERGVLLPGRVGVGKSFLIDCFASECGLPVMEMGDFRSKWVGDTERQLSRILMTIRALGPVIVVVDEADAVLGNRGTDGDSGVSTRVFAAFAAHIGDSSLRGRELWVAMTSRPDLLAIDMKRQGRFGLCIPLFAAQNAEEVMDLFRVIARTRKLSLSEGVKTYIERHLGDRRLTGSDVDAIINRAREAAVLAFRDDDVQVDDMEQAVTSFIDPLDPTLLDLQELAAVIACSDRRFLPDMFLNTDRSLLVERFNRIKATISR